MIEFSCHTWAFNDLTLMEALGTIARLGFRRVDIGSGQNFSTTRANPRQIAAEIVDDLRTFNLKVSDLYLMLPRISAADEDKRQKDLDLYRALIPFATAIGTPGITLSPGLAQEDEAASDRTTAALREMVSLGKQAGLRISIEPHLDSMASTPDDALKLVNDVPGLEITLDWAHMICQGVKHEAILPLLPHTRHMQMRQAAKNQLQTPFDKGKLDIPRILSDLQSVGYDGVICIEYMNTPGWHGMIAVDAVTESARLRDALRTARDAQQ